MAVNLRLIYGKGFFIVNMLINKAKNLSKKSFIYFANKKCKKGKLIFKISKVAAYSFKKLLKKLYNLVLYFISKNSQKKGKLKLKNKRRMHI